MGYIKEPEGIDFVADPTPLTKPIKAKRTLMKAYSIRD